MKRLVIQNQMDLLCLQEILKEYPSMVMSAGFRVSGITNSFIKNTLHKVNKIVGEKE